MEVKAIILWHYYNGSNQITKCSSTLFHGTAEELNARLNEENKPHEGEGLRAIVHQVVIFP